MCLSELKGIISQIRDSRTMEQLEVARFNESQNEEYREAMTYLLRNHTDFEFVRYKENGNIVIYATRKLSSLIFL